MECELLRQNMIAIDLLLRRYSTKKIYLSSHSLLGFPLLNLLIAIRLQPLVLKLSKEMWCTVVVLGHFYLYRGTQHSLKLNNKRKKKSKQVWNLSTLAL